MSKHLQVAWLMDLRGRATALQRPQMRRLLRRLLWSTLHGRRRWTAMTPSTRHAHAPALAHVWEYGCLLLSALSLLLGFFCAAAVKGERVGRSLHD